MTDARDETLVSLSRAAAVFGVDRRTLRAALRRLGASPANAPRRGDPLLFTWLDCGRALYGPTRLGEVGSREALLRRKTALELKVAELDIAEHAAALVRTADVEATAAACQAKARELLLAIPARIAAEVAAETDPHAIKSLIEGEFRMALQALEEN